MTGSISSVSKLAILSITVLVLVSSTGFSGAYFSDQVSSDTARIAVEDPEPTRGDLKFTPKALSTANQGTTTIHIAQPAGSTIDPETAVVSVDGREVDAPVRTCNPKKCLFKSSSQNVADAGGVGEPTLEVTATLENGSELEASTSIRIFDPSGPKDRSGPPGEHRGDPDEDRVDSDDNRDNSTSDTVKPDNHATEPYSHTNELDDNTDHSGTETAEKSTTSADEDGVTGGANESEGTDSDSRTDPATEPVETAGGGDETNEGAFGDEERAADSGSDDAGNGAVATNTSTDGGTDKNPTDEQTAAGDTTDKDALAEAVADEGSAGTEATADDTSGENDDSSNYRS